MDNFLSLTLTWFYTLAVPDGTGKGMLNLASTPTSSRGILLCFTFMSNFYFTYYIEWQGPHCIFLAQISPRVFSKSLGPYHLIKFPLTFSDSQGKKRAYLNLPLSNMFKH
jgi:hypothetical protein